MPNLRTHSLTVAQIEIGLSASVNVTGAAYQNGYIFKKFSGGTLAIVSGESAIASSGYIIGDNESINLDGPANFWLAAAGATCVVHAFWGQSGGAI